MPGRLIEENMWRAIRYGHGRPADRPRGRRVEEYPAAEALDGRRVDGAGPPELGIDVALPELNGAQRQRRMIDAAAPALHEVYAATVRETPRPTHEPRMPDDDQPMPTEEELRAASRRSCATLTRRGRPAADDRLAAQPRRPQGRAAPGTEDERDLEQVRTAIEGARALLPLVEAPAGEELAPIRDALSQLQMAYAQMSGEQGAARPPHSPAQTEGPGPAQQSGRLWSRASEHRTASAHSRARASALADSARCGGRTGLPLRFFLDFPRGFP